MSLCLRGQWVGVLLVRESGTAVPRLTGAAAAPWHPLHCQRRPPSRSASTKTLKGKAGFHSGGGGCRYSPLARPTPPPQKGLNGRAPKILPRLTPRPRRCPGSKIRQKMSMGFLESARQGGPEESSFAMDLKKELTIFNARKNVRRFWRQSS